MEEIIESVEYYYDEDFSVPFDIGLTEENNNSNNNTDYIYRGFCKYNDLSDEDDNEYRENEIQKVIFPVKLFYNDYIKKSSNFTKVTSEFIHSVHVEPKRPASNQSAAKMSCSSSSSPVSSNSTNNVNEKVTRFCCDTQSFMESQYSLRSRLPLFSMDNGRILANYHLNFVPHDYNTYSQIINSETSECRFEECDRLFEKEVLASTDFSDSGKFSAATVDSALLQQVANDYRNCHGINSLDKLNLKPDALLWRQIKFLMTYYYAGWSLIKIFKQSRRKLRPKCQSTDEIFCYQTRRTTKRIQRHSCTVLELFNRLKDIEEFSVQQPPAAVTATTATATTTTVTAAEDLKIRDIQHFSCQFPPRSKHPLQKQNTADHFNSPKKSSVSRQLDYPGIGKLHVPKPGRLNSASLLCNQFHSQLSFLQTSLSSSLTSSGRPLAKSETPARRDLSEFGDNLTLKPILHHSPDETDREWLRTTPNSVAVVRRKPPRHNGQPSASSSAANSQKRKSVSFDCPGADVLLTPASGGSPERRLQQIPREWGLLGRDGGGASINQLVQALIEAGAGSSPASTPSSAASVDQHQFGTGPARSSGSSTGSGGSKGLFERRHNSSGSDDVARLRGLLKECLRAVVHITERLSQQQQNGTNGTGSSSPQQQLVLMCEQLCEASNNSCCWDSPLAAVVDSVLALLADGLLSGSSAGHRRSTTRLWSLVEETSRCLTELHQLAREATRAAPHSHQQRVRGFLVRAIRVGALPVWLCALSTNEAVLVRFYGASSLLRRQHQLAQADPAVSLSALISALRTLCPPPTVVPSASNRTASRGPPPVTIARRHIDKQRVQQSQQSQQSRSHPPPPATYSTTESESCADDPVPTRDATNNNTTTTTVLRKSLSSNMPTHSLLFSRKVPTKSHSNHNCNSAATAAGTPPPTTSTSSPSTSSCNSGSNFLATPTPLLKTVYTQPIVAASRIGPSRLTNRRTPHHKLT